MFPSVSGDIGMDGKVCNQSRLNAAISLVELDRSGLAEAEHDVEIASRPATERMISSIWSLMPALWRRRDHDVDREQPLAEVA